VQIDFWKQKESIVLYRSIVKVMNIKWLKNRSDTIWRDTLEMTETTKPVWRILYKPPLPKRVGDHQWRILHGALVNSFVAMLNPNVSENCPFCNESDTVFHFFMFCNRLSFLFSLLELLFESFEVCFTKQNFILGCIYTINKIQMPTP